MLDGSLYVAAVLVVYLDVTAAPKWQSGWETTAVLFVGGCVILSFRLTGERRFHLTPLDFLVVFMALTLPNLPGSIASPQELGLAAIKLGILFYTIELLSGQSAGVRMAVRVASGMPLLIVAVRALT
jgi:UDP-GlcNAc:undecaprenyl-phosphate GlcNAc-1-phosphate transferase